MIHQTNLVLDISVGLIAVLIIIGSTSTIFKITKSQTVSLKFRNVFIFALAINYLAALITLFWITACYTSTDACQLLTTQGQAYDTVYVILSAIGNSQIFILVIFNIEILRIFSVLTTNFRPLLLKILLAVFSIAFICRLYDVVILRMAKSLFNDIITNIFNMGSVLYDNVQNGYLTILVFRYKEGFKQLQQGQLIYLQRMVLGIAFVGVSDWIGVGLAFKATFDRSYNSHFGIAACLVVCIHTLAMVYLLDLLKQFSFLKSPPETQVSSASVKRVMLQDAPVDIYSQRQTVKL
ncbi:hypothetical protein HDV01_001930 [Terramyces sp. JEL0728]|nr:hypothetical protein HDV01_001930 [Terramyces sp. JEL0728]